MSLQAEHSHAQKTSSLDLPVLDWYRPETHFYFDTIPHSVGHANTRPVQGCKIQQGLLMRN